MSVLLDVRILGVPNSSNRKSHARSQPHDTAGIVMSGAVMAWDPRSSRKYQATRKAWLPTADPTCCLCGAGVDVLLPHHYPASPTVEHTLPVRVILAQTQSRQAAIDLVCDTSLWLMAHSRCQSKQGAGVTNAQQQRPAGSRRW